MTPPCTVSEGALMLLEENEVAKLTMFVAEVNQITASVKVGPLTSEGEAVQLSELLSRGKIAVKELDALRREKVDPLNDEVKAINGIFRPLTDALAAFEQGAKRSLLAWQQAERARIERERREAQRKIEEAARKEAEAVARAEAAKSQKARDKAMAQAEDASRQQMAASIQAPDLPARGIRTDSGTSSTKERWVLHGIHDLDAVPLIYWRDDAVVEALTKVVQRAIRGGQREIPGCSIGLEEGLAVRVGV